MNEKPVSAATIVKLVLGLLVLAALLTAFGIRLWRFGAAAPLPALLQGLPDAHDDTSQQLFNQKLRERFPAGSLETDLISELRGEGFQLKTDARPPQRAASYDRAAGLQDLCRRGGNVHWSTDDAGRLSDISGGYYVYCP
jgi:hypothetical protein